MYESGRAFFPQWSGIAILTHVCAAEEPARRTTFHLLKLVPISKVRPDFTENTGEDATISLARGSL